GTRPIDVTASFSSLGGDDAASAQVAKAVTAHFAASDLPASDLPAAELFATPTVAAMADLLRDRFEGTAGSPVRILRPVPVSGSGARSSPPLFLFHPAGGPTSVYHPLVSQLPGDVGCIGFERLDDAPTVEQKATRYAEMLR
nr:phosphopantetheine-binding protein [Micromonospora sp. DSM 115978]